MNTRDERDADLIEQHLTSAAQAATAEGFEEPANRAAFIAAYMTEAGYTKERGAWVACAARPA